VKVRYVSGTAPGNKELEVCRGESSVCSGFQQFTKTRPDRAPSRSVVHGSPLHLKAVTVHVRTLVMIPAVTDEPPPSADGVKAEMSAYYDGLASNSAVARSLESGEDPIAVAASEPARRYFQMRKMREAKRLGGFQSAQRLVEVGCATGRYTIRLSTEMGFRMTGVDISPRSVEIARELAASLSLGDEITYLQGDFERMECLDDDSHDGLVSFSCIRYVPDPLAALRQARRVVKPGSRVVVDFPNRFCPWFKYLKTRLGVNVHFGDRHFSANESATCSPRPAWSRFGSLNACSRPLSRLRRSCWLSSSWIWLESGRQA
jgi:SAM-dependent methyltransferase